MTLISALKPTNAAMARDFELGQIDCDLEGSLANRVTMALHAVIQCRRENFETEDGWVRPEHQNSRDELFEAEHGLCVLYDRLLPRFKYLDQNLSAIITALSAPKPDEAALGASTATPTRKILDQILNERLRQNALVESEILPFNCSDPTASPGHKLMILAEEFGEVAKAAYEHWTGDPSRDAAQTHALRTELIQLAAVAAAWAESLTPIS